MVSDSGISKSAYASRARRLMKVAQQLRDLGAQAILDIPRIAVIGGQSAGKSSLVEAVSGIRVPRAAGTCTRCPMEVNLINRPGPWTCEVTLRFEYDSTGSPLNNVNRVQFGPPLSSNEDVEIALMRAQAAVLNYPALASESFMNKSRQEIEEYRTPKAFASGTLKFSKNVVCVDVYDSDCPDLSFVDLPGLIQNDTRELVNLVEDLVKSNIIGKCLILVAVPMSDDMENQRSMRLALEVDPEKNRTIGVLTKPDTLSKGATSARQKWKDVLSGTDHTNALKLGYFCVKLADDAERSKNLARADREALEVDFFKSTEPWSEIQNKGRFGVRNAVLDLSRLLTNLLDMTLPELREQAQEQLTECKDRLSELPEPIKVDPSTEILSRVTDFCQQLTATVRGLDVVTDSTISGTGGKVFVQKNRASYELLKRKIRSTAPDFRAFEDHTKYDNSTPGSDSDDDSLDTRDQGKLKCGPYDLYDVRRVIKASIAWELPNNVPFDAKRQLINSFTCLWDSPAIECFEAVMKHLTQYLNESVEDNFERFPKLRQYMSALVLEVVQVRKDLALAAVNAALKLEKDPLFTQNSHYLQAKRERYFAHFKHLRRYKSSYRKVTEAPQQPVRVPSPEYATEAEKESDGICYIGEAEESSLCLMPEVEPPRQRSWATPSTRAPAMPPRVTTPPMERVLRSLAAVGFHNLKEEDLTRLLPPDEFQEELMVMADVRAYFHVAYKRIIDHLPLTIEHALNQGLAEEMKTSLLQRLHLGAQGASQRLADLLEEDPELKQEREELETRKDRLEKVLQELRDFV